MGRKIKNRPLTHRDNISPCPLVIKQFIQDKLNYSIINIVDNKMYCYNVLNQRDKSIKTDTSITSKIVIDIISGRVLDHELIFKNKTFKKVIKKYSDDLEDYQIHFFRWHSNIVSCIKMFITGGWLYIDEKKMAIANAEKYFIGNYHKTNFKNCFEKTKTSILINETK